MKRILIAGAFALVSTLALAASWYDSGGTSISGEVLHWLNGSNVATPVSAANPMPVVIPSGGGASVVTVAPYAYTPLTPGQHNLAIVASTALTVPTGSTYATVCASTANVKYTTDGTTTPTSTIGMTLSTGACVTLSGATVIANFRAISATGTLDVEFFK